MQKFPNIYSNVEYSLLLFVSLIIIALFITLSFAAFPAADDYCYAVQTVKHGFLGSQAYWYYSWSGRYSSNAFMSLISLNGDINDAYTRVLIAAQLATLAAIFLLLRSLLQKRYPLSHILLASLTTYVIFLTGLPDVAQYVYWTMGVADYAQGNITVLLLLAIGAQRELGSISSRGLSILRFVIAAVLSIIAVGTNEVTLISVLAMLFGAAVLAIKTRTGSARFWTALFIIALFSASVSIFSPGNLLRSQSLATDGMLRPSGALAALLFLPWFLLRAAYWLANPAIWASAMIILVISWDKAKQLLYQDKVFKKSWLYVPVFWVALLLALTGLGFAINHYPLPERAESTVWLVFLLGWYPSSIIIFHFLVGSCAVSVFEPVKRFLVVFLLISMVGSPNIVEAFKDTYRGIRYFREMNARMGLITEAQKTSLTDLEVPTLSRPPRTLFTTDITSDQNNFRNTCLAEYYGLRSISH